MMPRQIFTPRSLFAVLTMCIFSATTTHAQPASVPYTWKRVEIGGGGFVTGIVFHPNYTNVAYCRTDVGGAYRWNEQTGSWEPLLDWFSGGLGVEAIAVDPNDPNMVYLTVGEDNWAGHDAFLVSSNRGTTWTRYTPPFGTAANNDGRSNGPRMMVDPNNTSILFYASHSGLYQSTNRGMTWSLVGSFPVTTTANGVGPNFVQFIKSSGTNGQATPKIFVGVSQTNNIGSSVYNLYYTSNGGTTWAGVNTTAADSNAGAPQMPHRPAQDGLGNLYVTFSSGPGPNGVASGSVLKINLSTLATTVVTPPTGQGGFAGVSVSQQNPNVVAVSTIDRWWPHDVIYLSTNGGASWTDTTQSGTMDLSSAPWWAWGGSVVGPVSSIGHWIGDCQIDPFRGDRMFFVGGGGVTAATNLLSSSRTFYAASTGIEEMGGTLSVPSSGPLLYSYFWDIGGFTHYNLDVSPDTTNHFTPIGGSITCGDHAELKPWIVVRVSYGLPTYGAYSTDYGASWTNFGSCPAIVTNNGPNYIAVSASGSNLVWTPWSANQYWSGDKGTTWTPVVGGTTNSSGYVAISDRASDADFYIYDPPNGTFRRSSNGGRNFAIVNSSLPTWANTPATVFGRAGDIWLPSGNGLYHSTNYGSNWVQVLGGVDVCKVAFGKAAPGASYPAIYIGAKMTDLSIYDTYRSIDGGATWVRINDDQHRFGVYGNMRGDPNIYGRVYRENRCYGITYADIASNMPVNNVYELVNRNSGLAADNMSGSMTSGVQMVQSAINGNNNQQWLLENLGGGKVKLVNQLSGLVLGMAAGALTNGAPVIQSAWENTDNQKWLLTPTDSGYYKLINVASGKALEATGGSAAVGTGLGQGSDASANYQQWTFAQSSPTMTKLAGTIIGSTGSWGNFGNTISNVFDGNLSNYYDAVNASGDWAGLDVGAGPQPVVTQIKYCPRSGLGNRMVGGQFQGANVADFSSGVVTLFTVGSAPPDGVMTVQALTNAASFRYLRYLGPAYCYCNVAEVQFWRSNAVAPSAPTGLSAVAGDAQVTLNWNLTSSATGYKIKRSTVSGGGYTSIATNPSLVFTNTSLSNGTLYYFVVTATNSYGESTNSVEVSARPTSRAVPQLGYGTTAGQMQLSWPADHTGWQLLVQTNSLASGLGANWTPVPGSTDTNLMSLPVDAAAGSVFYRLFLP